MDHFGSQNASLLAPLGRPKSDKKSIKNWTALNITASSPQDRPRPPPRASQELPRAPKTAPRHPKMLPRGRKYSQERLKTAPQALRNGIARRASSSASTRGDPQNWGSGGCCRRRRSRSGRSPLAGGPCQNYFGRLVQKQSMKIDSQTP